ncbi:hypothetical protein SLE2022_051200 [Rubroshorea leprosula]
MKFPLPIGVATLKGNQEIAKHYYMTSVTRPWQDKEETLLLEPAQPETPSNQQVMGVELLDNQPNNEVKAPTVEQLEEVQINDNDPTKKMQIKTKLSSKEREDNKNFLKVNNDVFAWTLVDMPGIPTSVATHKQSTNPLKRPIA